MRQSGLLKTDRWVACLFFVFLCSGASALMFQALWFRQLGLLFGNSMVATSLVLSSFMAGLGLGNVLVGRWGFRLKSCLKWYAAAEVLVGLSGIVLVLIIPKMTVFLRPLLVGAANVGSEQHIIRSGVSFAMLLVPTVAMGATLPLIVRGLHRCRADFGWILGKCYGWNTLGGMVGVLAGDLVLIHHFGVRGTAFLAGGLNILAAIVVLSLTHVVEGEAPSCTTRHVFKTPWHASRLLGAAFLSGFIFLALELVWFRFLLLFFDALTLNFAIMLGVILLGIGLGGMIGAFWCDRHATGFRALPHLFALNGLLVLGSFACFPWIMEPLAQSHQIVLIPVAIYLILPTAVFSGITYILLGKALYEKIPSETEATGFLTCVNTFGAMLGALLGGWYLIPTLGMERSMLLLACLYLLNAGVVSPLRQVRKAGSFSFVFWILCLAFALVLWLFPRGLVQQRLARLSIEQFESENGEVRVAICEGLHETMQYLRKDLAGYPFYYRLVTNDHSMSATDLYAKRYMRLFAYLAVAIHDRPAQALLICYGCGSSAQALVNCEEVQQVHIVDISADVFRLSDVVYPNPSENPVLNPKVSTYVEDGRYFLQTATQGFDVITAEPPPSQVRGRGQSLHKRILSAHLRPPQPRRRGHVLVAGESAGSERNPCNYQRVRPGF